MSYREIEEAKSERWRIEWDHNDRTKRANEEHLKNVQRYEEEMKATSGEFEKASSQLKDLNLAHADAMEKLNKEEFEREKVKKADHGKEATELRNVHHQELETQRQANAAILKETVKSQSAEKKRLEESRQQLNKESAERAAAEASETARVQRLADEQAAEQTQREQTVDRRNLDETKAMRNELLNVRQAEHRRIEQHAGAMNALEVMRVTQLAEMELAERAMANNRERRDLLNEIGDEVNRIVSKFGELKGKVDVAVKMKKASVLKRQTIGITLCLEVIRSSRSQITVQLDNPSLLTIDEHDEQRKSTFIAIRDQLAHLAPLLETLPICLEALRESLEYDVVEMAKEAVEDAKGAVDAVQLLWRQVPRVDTTNLVYEQYLRHTEQLMGGGAQMALE